MAANLKFVEDTLFGEDDAVASCDGEYYAAHEIALRWKGAQERADWCMNYLEHTGTLMLEEEDSLLLNDCLNSYVMGFYAAAIITADALIERLLTDFLESRHMKKAAAGTLGKKISELEKTRLIDLNVLSRISLLHKIRNNLAHERGPNDKFRIIHRSLARGVSSQLILRYDAQEAVMLAFGIAARVKRNFPRIQASLS